MKEVVPVVIILLFFFLFFFWLSISYRGQLHWTLVLYVSVNKVENAKFLVLSVRDFFFLHFGEGGLLDFGVTRKQCFFF